MQADVISKVMEGGEAWVKADRGLLRVKGADRVRFLNGQVTNDVSKIPVGHAWYAATCTAKGKMVADLWISNQGEEFWLDTVGEQREILRMRLEKYLIADDVEITPVEGMELFHQLGVSLLEKSEGEICFESARFGLSGRDIWIQEGSVGKNGVFLDSESLKCLRVLKRVPVWGRELSVDILPPEAGMDRNAIRYDKGCYVGQEVIARIKSIGHVTKVLVLMESATPVVPAEGSRLSFEGKDVGWVTSSTLNPFTQRGMALGYVQWRLASTPAVLETGGLALTIRLENA